MNRVYAFYLDNELPDEASKDLESSVCGEQFMYKTENEEIFKDAILFAVKNEIVVWSVFSYDKAEENKKPLLTDEDWERLEGKGETIKREDFFERVKNIDPSKAKRITLDELLEKHRSQ